MIVISSFDTKGQRMSSFKINFNWSRKRVFLQLFTRSLPKDLHSIKSKSNFQSFQTLLKLISPSTQFLKQQHQFLSGLMI